MEKLYILIFIFVAVFQKLPANDTIKINNPIERTLKLNFDKNAKENNVFIEWTIQADFKNLDINFSQGELINNEKFKILASEYSEIKNGIEGIRLTIKPDKKAESGIYNFKMFLFEYSDGLEGIDTNKLNLEIKNIVIPSPPFPWTKVIIIILIVIVLAIITFFLISQSQKFKSGSILVEEPTEKANTYFLKGKKRFLFSEFYDCNAYLSKGTDGHPKIYFDSETVYVNGDFASKGLQLALMDEGEIITLENEKIKFIYQ